MCESGRVAKWFRLIVRGSGQSLAWKQLARRAALRAEGLIETCVS